MKNLNLIRPDFFKSVYLVSDKQSNIDCSFSQNYQNNYKKKYIYTFKTKCSIKTGPKIEKRSVKTDPLGDTATVAD